MGTTRLEFVTSGRSVAISSFAVGQESACASTAASDASRDIELIPKTRLFIATFARAMPRDRTDQPPGSTINSPTIDGWWIPQPNLNTPALSAVNVTVVSWPRLTVKLIS